MPEDSAKVKSYFNLFWLEYRNDYDAAYNHALAAEKLSKKLGYDFQYADAIRVKSFALVGMGNYEASKQALDQSLELFTAMGDKKMIADVKIELGSLAQTQNNLEEALLYFLEALDICKAIGDQNSVARTLNYIGAIYKRQKQYDKSIINFKEALKLVEEQDFKMGISACLTNLASVYVLTERYGEALQLHEKALKLKVELNDKLGQGRVLNNIGVVQNLMNDHTSASDNFDRALELAQEIGDKKLHSDALYGKVETAFAQSSYGQSSTLGEDLLKFSDSLMDLELEVKLHNVLFKSYTNLKNYDEAFDHASKWQKLSDSLYDKNIVSLTNELETKYQNEQKTKEIELLAANNELQELQLGNREKERNAIIVFALLLLISVGLLFSQYRTKQKANKELRELDKLKSNFFANISHEFRTPLTLIKGPIEHLEQNPEEKLGTDDVKMIRRNTNKVLGLVNQLLELSKIDQGKLQLKPTEGDVYKCLRAAVFSFNSHAAQRHMDYRVEIPNEHFWASFDRDKLEKVVYNLLSNAFKFSQDGAMVSFTASYADDQLQLQVSDSGKGISEDKLPFIFDRFYQVDGSATKEREGSGIGLSLSKDLIELMDGTITASSEEGKGTFFTVQLPITKIKTREKSGEFSIGRSVEEVHSKPYEFESKESSDLPKILLVEDNSDMRQFIKGTLKNSYRVIEAQDGATGLEMAQSTQPDLMITDLMMPKMDGIELCKHVKENLDTSHLPIIMLTAKAGMENKIEGLESGADDYLTKPFNAKELTARVQNLITQRQRLREHFKKSETKVDPSKIATSSLDQKFLSKLLQILEQEHPDASFGVPQMQDAMAMSKTQLHRKVKALTGESPGELLRNFRLKRAAHLLSNKSDTVTQIAYQVGFNNLSYFAKCFKALYGVSPSSY